MGGAVDPHPTLPIRGRTSSMSSQLLTVGSWLGSEVGCSPWLCFLGEEPPVVPPVYPGHAGCRPGAGKASGVAAMPTAPYPWVARQGRASRPQSRPQGLGEWGTTTPTSAPSKASRSHFLPRSPRGPQAWIVLGGARQPPAMELGQCRAAPSPAASSGPRTTLQRPPFRRWGHEGLEQVACPWLSAGVPPGTQGLPG